MALADPAANPCPRANPGCAQPLPGVALKGMAGTRGPQEDAPPAPLSAAEAAAYARRDLSEVLWFYLEGLRRELGFNAGAQFTSAARAILACPPDEADLADAIAVAVVNGRVVHGLAPRDAGEWAIAERIYEQSTVKELEAWAQEQGTARA